MESEMNDHPDATATRRRTGTERAEMEFTPAHPLALVDAVARSLAKSDGRFIGAVEWVGEAGDVYRDKAFAALDTIRRFEAGNGTGGVSP
jgi:hypothetical protein